VPSWVAFAVTGLLEQHFGRLVDYDFTAAMEDELDAIAAGQEQRTNWLNNFYFGGDHGVADSVHERASRNLSASTSKALTLENQLHQVV